MKLNAREKQIARLVIAGEKRSAIAAELGLHSRTIDYHLQILRAKLGVSSLVQLAVKCIRCRLVRAVAS